MDYISLIHQFIDPIVTDLDKLTITEEKGEKENEITYVISCSKNDTGRLIGKHGQTADALREVISIAGKDNKQRIHLRLVSIEE